MPRHDWAIAELRREWGRSSLRSWRRVQRHSSSAELEGVAGYTALPWSRAIELHRRRLADPGSVWAVAMVRDEADVVPHTIEHLLGQGVRHVLVADNLSSDGTTELLHELARRWPVTVVRDDLPAMLQEHKMTRLARLATAAGAEWIVPFDADELWCATGGTLAATLARSPQSVLAAPMHDHIPSVDDDALQPNPYLRMTRRLVEPKVMGKVAFRAHRLAFLEAGNHSVRHPTGEAVESELFIRHVPFRSTEQVVRKVRQGAAASIAAARDGNFSVHWRALVDLPDDEIMAYYLRANQQTVVDPAPFTSFTGGA
ncbi:MAG: glycosyltransferase family 2 protein [Actinomycetota bacterium]